MVSDCFLTKSPPPFQKIPRELGFADTFAMKPANWSVNHSKRCGENDAAAKQKTGVQQLQQQQQLQPQQLLYGCGRL